MTEIAARRTLTVEEAAALLGISRGLAYALVRQREIPSLRLGRRIVVPRAAVDDLLEPSTASLTRPYPSPRPTSA